MKVARWLNRCWYYTPILYDSYFVQIAKFLDNKIKVTGPNCPAMASLIFRLSSDFIYVKFVVQEGFAFVQWVNLANLPFRIFLLHENEVFYC